jgi:hypothetical protein
MTFSVFLLILVLLYIFFSRHTEGFSAIKLPFVVTDATNKVKK